jgi:hypothetical protein
MNPEVTGQFCRQDPLDASSQEAQGAFIPDNGVLRVVSKLLELQRGDTRLMPPGRYLITTPIPFDELLIWERHVPLTERYLELEEGLDVFVKAEAPPDEPFPGGEELLRRDLEPAVVTVPQFMYAPVVTVSIDQDVAFSFSIGVKDDSGRWIFQKPKSTLLEQQQTPGQQALRRAQSYYVRFTPLDVDFNFFTGQFQLSQEDKIDFIGSNFISAYLKDPADMSKVKISKNPTLRLVFWQLDKLMKEGKVPFIKPEPQFSEELES